MDALGKSPLQLLRRCLLDCLGHVALASSVADLAGLLVAAGIVDAIGELLLEALGCGFLDLAGDLGVAGVGGALALLVGAGGCGGRHSECLDLTVEDCWFDGLFDCGCVEGFHF